ncbi:MAG: uroporphyrinogen-III synthase [Candidatus Binatia bacterium]
MRAGLQGLKVVSFESRRARETAELIRRQGGEPIVAPSMREIPLSENTAPLEFFKKLIAGEIDAVILLTGVGTRTMVETLAAHYSKERIAELLGSVAIIARGPKPVSALKELGLSPTMTAPEPNTWKEVLSIIDGNMELKGKRVAVQEYGVTNDELLSCLEARGATVARVPVYRWALPEDIGPLRTAIREVKNGGADIAVFTSATQVEHLFKVARQDHVESDLRAAFARVLVASIGPVCSEALARVGLRADFEPEHPKMGQLIGELAQHGREALEKKRQACAILNK